MNNNQISMENIIALYNKGQMREMVNLAKKYIKDFPDSVAGKNALALGLKSIGSFDESKNIFINIIDEYKKDQKIAFIYTNLGNLLYDIGQIDNAIKYHNIGIELDKNNINSMLGLGLAYSNKGMNNKSIDIYKSALRLDKNNSNIIYNLATSLRKIEIYDEAAYYYSKSNNRLSKSYQLECLYLNTHDKESKDDFYKFLNELAEYDKDDALIASISRHASIRFENNDNCNFCDKPFQFIKKVNLFNEKDFNDQLISGILKDIDHSRVSKKPQSLLSNGVQSSGNLFNLEYSSIQKLKKIILKRIDKYRESYKTSNVNYIKKWPKKFNLYGWVILMDSGGSLLPHIHKEGWLSSSIYLKRPERNEKNDGDIKFSLHGGNYPSNGKNFPEKIINIDEGDMVMFPSSVFHSTIPFASSKKRVTFAFDIIPSDI